MAFKSIFPPDPFGREHPQLGEGILVSNVAPRQAGGVSNYEFHRAQPVLRTAEESLGKVLFSPSSGLTYVAYKLYDDKESGTFAVIDGSDTYKPTGYHLVSSGRELEVALERDYAAPGSAPKHSTHPLILNESQLRAHNLAEGYDNPGEGPFLVRQSPDGRMTLPNYLGNLPWKRTVPESLGKILHVHHLDATLVPLRFSKGRGMECVVLDSLEYPEGTIVTATWDEIRTAELLPLGPLPDGEVVDVAPAGERVASR